MGQKAKVIDALVDIGSELCGTGADCEASTADITTKLARIVLGLPRSAGAVKETLAVALEALRAVGAGSMTDPAAAVTAVGRTVIASARRLAGENDNGSNRPLEEHTEVLRSLLGAAKTEPPPAGPARRPQQPAAATAVMPEAADAGIIREYVVECLEHISAAEAALVDSQSGTDAERINTVFRAFHTIKSSSNMLSLDWVQQLAQAAEDILARARAGEISISGHTDLLLESCDLLKAMIESLTGCRPGDRIAIPGDADRLRGLLTGSQEAESDTKSPLKRPGPASLADAPDTSRDRCERSAERTIRVRAGKLDGLVDMVGELVIAHSMVSECSALADSDDARLTGKVAHVGKIIDKVRDMTMSLRMVTLHRTFEKMARLVYDLGRKTGKPVQFSAEGEETEIDRNLVDSLSDPLIHMIRNTVGHGLEPADERAAAGKPPPGRVSLRAYHSAGHVVIELADDGRGLDPAEITARAVALGLIEDQGDLTDTEALSLIFEPGFSTARTTTDVSGRGVGLDVVKKAVESLRGRVEVASGPGEGATFTLRLPLTLAVTDAMLLRVGDERFLLPTISIEQSFRPEPSAVSIVAGKAEVVTFRGDLLPVLRLSRLFGIDNAVTDLCEGVLVVIESNRRRCVLMVDEILGRQQAVIKALGPPFGQLPGVGGAAILGDGRIGLILNAAGILRLTRKGAGKENAAAA